MKRYTLAKEADLFEWIENIIAVSQANKTAWSLPKGKLMDLRALRNEVKRLYDLCQTAS
jgi:hypothetical protein